MANYQSNLGDRVNKKKKSGKPFNFQKGGLHQKTGTPEGESISEEKKEMAEEGAFGAKAKMAAQFSKGKGK